MSQIEVIELYRRIANAEHGYERGDFLTEFARAVIRADLENFEILRPAAEALIAKYQLDKEGK